MYEVMLHGESLDPLGQGEYIEHRHRPVTCNTGLHLFPTLKVDSSAYPHNFNIHCVVRVITSTVLSQKAKAQPVQSKEHIVSKNQK